MRGPQKPVSTGFQNCHLSPDHPNFPFEEFLKGASTFDHEYSLVQGRQKVKRQGEDELNISNNTPTKLAERPLSDSP
jgi:hypothetical protein